MLQKQNISDKFKTKSIQLMKTFRLLIVALLLAGSASAQRYERRAMRGLSEEERRAFLCTLRRICRNMEMGEEEEV